MKKSQKRWQDEYLCMWSYKLKPVCMEYLEQIGQEYLNWTREIRKTKPQDRDKFSLERFLEEKGIPIQTMNTWRKACPKLNQAILAGNLIIGNILEEGLITKRYSEKGAHFVLHNYLPRYKNDNKYHQDLKNIKDAVAELLGVKFDVPDLDGKE